MSEVSKDIENKLRTTITIVIFLFVVVKSFVELNSSLQPNKVFLGWTALIVIYIWAYILFYLSRDNISESKSNFINKLLNFNFAIISTAILFMSLNQYLNYFRGIVGVIIILIFYINLLLLVIFPSIIIWSFALSVKKTIKDSGENMKKKESLFMNVAVGIISGIISGWVLIASQKLSDSFPWILVFSIVLGGLAIFIMYKSIMKIKSN